MVGPDAYDERKTTDVRTGTSLDVRAGKLFDLRVYKSEADIGTTLPHDTLPLADFAIEDAEDLLQQRFIIRLCPHFEGDVAHTVSLASEELKMKWLQRLQHRKVEQEEQRMHLQETEDEVTGPASHVEVNAEVPVEGGSDAPSRGAACECALM